MVAILIIILYLQQDMTRKIISISLALLTLFFSLKTGIALHFCGGKLAQSKIILGHGNANCGMDQKESKCNNDSPLSIKNIPCCKNLVQQIITDDFQLAKNIKHFVIVQISFLSQSGYIPASHINFVSNCILCKPPPGLTSVSLAQIQIFLI